MENERLWGYVGVKRVNSQSHDFLLRVQYTVATYFGSLKTGVAIPVFKKYLIISFTGPLGFRVLRVLD